MIVNDGIINRRDQNRQRDIFYAYFRNPLLHRPVVLGNEEAEHEVKNMQQEARIRKDKLNGKRSRNNVSRASCAKPKKICIRKKKTIANLHE